MEKPSHLPPVKPPSYIIPDMNAWKAHVKSRNTKEELDGAVDFLRLARSTAGIHPFLLNNQMGLARWYLTQRAEKLGFYKMGNGYYQELPTI